MKKCEACREVLAQEPAYGTMHVRCIKRLLHR